MEAEGASGGGAGGALEGEGVGGPVVGARLFDVADAAGADHLRERVAGKGLTERTAIDRRLDSGEVVNGG